MKKIVETNHAPKAIGPYSQAVIAENLMFISGQIPINPQTNEIVEGIENQTKQVMQNLLAILESQNVTFSNVVKSSIFIKNMNDFNEINQIYASYFESGNAPARETVEVSRLPKDVLIEISMIALIS
jgi:2-iminobutanoate/2-iminopropanoate deaminase